MLRMVLIKADSRKTRQIWNRCWEMGKSCWERSRGVASVCKGPAEVGTSWQCNEGSQHSYLMFSNNPQQPGNRHDGNRQLGHLGTRDWLGMCKGMKGKERKGRVLAWAVALRLATRARSCARKEYLEKTYSRMNTSTTLGVLIALFTSRVHQVLWTWGSSFKCLSWHGEVASPHLLILERTNWENLT